MTSEAEHRRRETAGNRARANAVVREGRQQSKALELAVEPDNDPAKLAAIRAAAQGPSRKLCDEALGLLLGMVAGDVGLALDAIRMVPRPIWLEQLEELSTSDLL